MKVIADAQPKGPSKKQEEDYQAEEDARTLQRVGEILSDPKRYQKARVKLTETMGDMKKSIKAMNMMKNLSGLSDQEKFEIERESRGAKRY